MKPLKTKRDLRAELDHQMAEYLESGGRISEVAAGTSGREHLKGPLTPIFTPRESVQGRTLVTEVVAAVEARRRPQPASRASRKPSRPHKRMVLDDFGQPLRWEWVEK